MLKYTFFLTAFLWFISNAAGQKPQGDPKDSPDNFTVFTIEGGESPGNNRAALAFYYHDSLGFGKPVSIGKGGANLLLTAPTLLFEASSSQMPFLIYPGEQITVKYFGTDSVKMYIPGNSQRSDELAFFRTLVKNSGKMYEGMELSSYLEMKTSLEGIDSAKQIIHSIKENRLSFLKDYSLHHSISNNFKNLAINCIQSKALNDSMLLFYLNRALLTDAKLYRGLMEEKFRSFKSIEYAPYQIYLNACLTMTSLMMKNTTYASVNNVNEFKTVFNFVENNSSGITRDFLLANTISKGYANSVAMPADYINRFNKLCQNQIYKNIIAQKLQDKKADLFTKGLDKLLSPDGTSAQDIQVVLKKYEGKIILLDFWASWCFPCRAELPSFKKMKKDFGEKNIAFVSVSSDQSVKDWLRAIKEESLEDENSFLLLNFDASVFVKKYNIYAIPRYMLIGRDGKVINADAPRPSDPGLAKLINRYL